MAERMDAGRVAGRDTILGELEEEDEELAYVWLLEVGRKATHGGKVDCADSFVNAVVVRRHLGR